MLLSFKNFLRLCLYTLRDINKGSVLKGAKKFALRNEREQCMGLWNRNFWSRSVCLLMQLDFFTLNIY